MDFKTSFKTKKNRVKKDNQTDKVYTPYEVAEYIVKDINEKFGVSGKVLEPCKGGGSFYKAFDTLKNIKKDYCEIDEGKDFLTYGKRVDWIITNPPYSIFDDFLMHSMEICDNIVFLIPINKLTSSHRRIMDLLNFGGVRYIKIFKGHECNFPFGFAIGAVYIKKGYKGKIEIDVKN